MRKATLRLLVEHFTTTPPALLRAA